MARFYTAAALMIVLAACSGAQTPQAQRNDSTGPAARIDESTLLRDHPFAPVVAQLDSDIATLEESLHGGLSNAGAALEGSRTVLRAQLSNAAARARGIEIAPPSRTHVQPPALRDFAQGPSIEAFRSAMDARIQRAVELRAAQMREEEATADYQYGRAHAGEVLQLQLRSRSPYLDDRARRAILARLNAIEAEEQRVLAALHARNVAQLAQFKNVLAADGARGIASMERDLQAHAAAVRQIPQPSNAVVARAESIPSRTNSAQTAAAFERASDDLSARFGELHAWNANDIASARQEITALKAERDRLVSEMRAQIEAQAQRIAHDRGLGKVYSSNSPQGAADLTRDVAAAIDSIRG